ncbi:hypothetical protein BH18THE2_BH18THE2_25780 [soil metagenome]
MVKIPNNPRNKFESKYNGIKSPMRQCKHNPVRMFESKYGLIANRSSENFQQSLSYML